MVDVEDVVLVVAVVVVKEVVFLAVAFFIVVFFVDVVVVGVVLTGVVVVLRVRQAGPVTNGSGRRSTSAQILSPKYSGLSSAAMLTLSYGLGRTVTVVVGFDVVVVVVVVVTVVGTIVVLRGFVAGVNISGGCPEPSSSSSSSDKKTTGGAA